MLRHAMLPMLPICYKRHATAAAADVYALILLRHATTLIAIVRCCATRASATLMFAGASRQLRHLIFDGAYAAALRFRMAMSRLRCQRRYAATPLFARRFSMRFRHAC